MKYGNILEEELKIKVGQDYFGEFDATKIIGKVDFCAVEKTNLFEPQTFLWAEAKQGKADIVKSFVQLILTIGKARTFTKFSPPLFLGAFDAFEMAFVPYSEIQDFFDLNDFNWTVTPSNYKSKEFIQLHQKVESILQNQSLTFNFEKDDLELREFVKTNFVANRTSLGKMQIDKNNFRTIYLKWVDQVRPSLNVLNWELAKKEANIKDSDFFIADLFTNTPTSFKDTLEAWLTENGYKYNKISKVYGGYSSDEITFWDNKIAHIKFWNKYERPPREDFWNYIVQRQDKLLPPSERENKGAYFTPNFAVEKSQEYLKNIFGEDWQDEYYIWDCCAGSGNLLCNLIEPTNIWASTLDNSDVKSIKTLIENQHSPLYPQNVFQFDFLNDDFSKCPSDLQEILKDPEKRKKLIIYINPPYAQATSSKTVVGTSQNKTGVATKNLANEKYKSKIGKACNELFALFMARIYDEISGCKLGQFSKFSFVQGDSFADFRTFFKAKYLGGFIIPSKSFDNTSGNWPLGFTVWDLGQKEQIKLVKCDVYTTKNENIGTKTFRGDLPKSINKWLTQFNNKTNEIGLMVNCAPDFGHNQQLAILSKKQKRYCLPITQKNIICICIYFSIRHSVKATWLNDRDKFLAPNKGWKTDSEFQNNCLAYTLFHTQNRVTCREGINYWIPFKEREVGNRQKAFDSDFMTKYMAGKLVEKTEGIFEDITQEFPLEFSQEAKAVFDAGRELWKYYHGLDYSQNCNMAIALANYNVNASFYDIREHFQGTNPKTGNMNPKSSDQKYTQLLKTLKEKMDILASQIEPKIYEYEFLL